MKTNTYEKSHELFNRATKVIPCGIYGHLGPKHNRMTPMDAFPLFSEHAKGSYFWDVDGNRFIDFMCAYGPNVLGYSDPDVDAAVQAAMARSANVVTAPDKSMVEFAELMVDTVASADWAFFCKNGGDVTQLAIIAARAAAGRKTILAFDGYYHGVSPWSQTKFSNGILQEEVANTVTLPWNDFEAVEAYVKAHPGQVAGIISTPYQHPTSADNVMPLPDFWPRIRKLCDENGIVLIFDDVRCGFRMDMAGSDHYFGIKADLICFCKAIANGYNVSALCGAAALKNTVAEITYTGSYWTSMIPFVAGMATITKLKAIDGITYMQKMGKKLTDGFRDIGKSYGFDLRVTGMPSLFYLRVVDPEDSFMYQQEWAGECTRRGVMLSHYHNMFASCTLTDEDIQFCWDVADEAFLLLRKKHPLMV